MADTKHDKPSNYLISFETTVYACFPDGDLDETFSFRVRVKATDEAASVRFAKEIQNDVQRRIEEKTK